MPSKKAVIARVVRNAVTAQASFTQAEIEFNETRRAFFGADVVSRRR